MASFKEFITKRKNQESEKLLAEQLEQELNEAVFSEQNLSKVMQLYSKLFAKQFGSKFYFLGEEGFKKAGSKGVGARYINEQGYQIRFNWDQADMRNLKQLDNQSKGKKLYLSSIDYWSPVNDNFARPTTSLKFLSEVNVVQIWQKVSKLLKKGVRGSYTLREIMDDHTQLSEATANDLKSDQVKDFLKKNGFKSNVVYRTDKKTLQNMLDDDPELQAKLDEYVIEIQQGKPEENDFDNNLKDSKKKLDQQVYCDPDLVFQDIENMTEFIAKKGSKSFICCGLGGIGKCIDSDTKIASPDGVFRAGDVKKGMRVFTPTGKISAIQEVYPQDELHECYEIELESGKKLICDDEQLFSVLPENAQSEAILSLKEFRQSKNVKFPVVNENFEKHYESIKDIKPVGLKETICFKIDDPESLFLTDDYVVVHNTFHITSTLQRLFGEAGLEWNYHSGMKTTPFTIYKTIFQERDLTIVFDEADDMLKNQDIVVQLKPCLDTSGDNTMEYSAGTASMLGKTRKEIEEYCTEVDLKLKEGKFLGPNNKGDSVMAPSKFYFTGQMIFISNMPASKIDQAIMSRSLFIDVQLCAQDINKRIHTIMRAKYKDMNDNEIDEIMSALGQSLPKVSETPNVQYMTPELARAQKPVTVRSMTIAIEMKRRGVPNWQRLASLYV